MYLYICLAYLVGIKLPSLVIVKFLDHWYALKQHLGLLLLGSAMVVWVGRCGT